VAPDAPPPVRNTLGDIVGSWEVRLRYDEVLDEIHLHVNRPGGPWAKPVRARLVYKPEEIEDAIDKAVIMVRVAGARRLF
jgi:hypothetical protein